MNPEEDDIPPVITSQPVPDAVEGCTCFDDTFEGECPVHAWDEYELDAWNGAGAYDPERNRTPLEEAARSTLLFALKLGFVSFVVLAIYLWTTH